MKLIIYNESNCRSVKIGAATIRIRRESGVIALSKRSIEIIGAKAGDRVYFLQDETRPKDWYIMKTQSIDGFKLREYNKSKGRKALLLNNSATVHKIMESLAITEKTIAFHIASQATEHEGTNLYAILTSKPLK
jgi:hypothetical protein